MTDSDRFLLYAFSIASFHSDVFIHSFSFLKGKSMALKVEGCEEINSSLEKKGDVRDPYFIIGHRLSERRADNFLGVEECG